MKFALEGSLKFLKIAKSFCGFHTVFAYPIIACLPHKIIFLQYSLYPLLKKSLKLKRQIPKVHKCVQITDKTLLKHSKNYHKSYCEISPAIHTWQSFITFCQNMYVVLGHQQWLMYTTNYSHTFHPEMIFNHRWNHHESRRIEVPASLQHKALK